jgi:hypothetical protein
LGGPFFRVSLRGCGFLRATSSARFWRTRWDARSRRSSIGRAAGPDQLEGQEQPPGRVASDDRPRNDVAGHRRRVDAMSAEAAGQPDAGNDLADLRHAVNGIAQDAAPGIVDFHIAKLRIDAPDVAPQTFRITPRIRFPCGHAPGPDDAIVHHAIVVVGPVRVRYRSAPRNGVGKPSRLQRLRRDDIGAHRQYRARDLGHHGAEMRVAGEHDMRGPHSCIRRRHALAHAGRIDRQRGRLFTDAGARVFCKPCKRQGIGQRMDVERIRKSDRLEVIRSLQDLPHLLRR